MKNSLVKKLGIGITTGGIVLGANSLDANAQKRNTELPVPEYHNTGATIQKYQVEVDGYLERKVTHEKGKYFQNIPFTVEGKYRKGEIPHEKTFGDSLNLISFYYNTAKLDLDASSGKPLVLGSGKPFNWTQAKDENGNNITVVPLKMTKELEQYVRILCNNQAAEADGTSADRIRLDKNLTPKGLQTITLYREVNGELIKDDFFYPLLPENRMDSTKMEHFLIPNIEGYTRLRILPAEGNTASRQVAIVSPWVYDANLDQQRELVIKSTPGQATNVYAEPIEESKEEEKEETSTSKKKDLYLIFGGEGNDKYAAGKVGLRGKHLGFVANGGPLFKSVKNVITPVSPYSGRYGDMSKETKGVKFGAALEGYLGNNWELYAGLGADYLMINEKNTENIMKDGEIIEPSSNSRAYNELSPKAYGGIAKALGKNKNVKVRAGAGHSAKEGTYVDAALMINILKK